MNLTHRTKNKKIKNEKNKRKKEKRQVQIILFCILKSRREYIKYVAMRNKCFS